MDQTLREQTLELVEDTTNLILADTRPELLDEVSLERLLSIRDHLRTCSHGTEEETHAIQRAHVIVELTGTYREAAEKMLVTGKARYWANGVERPPGDIADDLELLGARIAWANREWRRALLRETEARG